MKVTINVDKCTGHGRCYDLAPEVFEDDESGYGQVRAAEFPAELEAQARLAAVSCPEQAITVET